MSPELRKALEVALHAGAIAGLALASRRELEAELRQLDRHRVAMIAVASAPAGVAGYTLERQIEARLGRPPTIALGLLAGGLALAAADRSPQRRRAGEARLADACWLGLAQACALIPGVSRSGATLAAARFRRFRRGDAALLSRQLAFPVIGGATLLKAWRLRRQETAARPQLAAAAAASFTSTILTARLIRSSHRPLLPYAVYRSVLAAIILLRLRDESRPR